jgi:hypothetical protein
VVARETTRGILRIVNVCRIAGMLMQRCSANLKKMISWTANDWAFKNGVGCGLVTPAARHIERMGAESRDRAPAAV